LNAEADSESRSETVAAATFLAIALAAAGCAADRSLKHRCRVDGDCAWDRVCLGSTCQSQGSRADASADVPPQAGDGPPTLESLRPNIVFVTSERFTTTFRPVDVADQKCNEAAQRASLPGRYRAWLSTSNPYASEKLGRARGWVRPDGAPFADRVEDITSGRILTPPLIDERGRPTLGGPEDPVATGTLPTGENVPGGNCHEWRSDRPENVVVGIADGTTSDWTHSDRVFVFCGMAVRLYCFGVDQDFPLPPRPVSGKRAFVSDSAFAPGDGIVQADELCANEAAEAGMRGTFVALLPAGGRPAAARLSAPESTVWFRLDGVAINEPGTDLMTGAPLRAPLNLTSKGRYLSGPSGHVLTGARTPTTSVAAADVCDDWTNPNKTASGGSMSRVGDWWSPRVLINCYNGGRIYCFEI
jgi:hypothetical protein